MFNNDNYSKETAIRIPVNTVEIYRAHGEFWYSHCPFITFFKGRMVAMWSAGKLHEEEDGEEIMLSFSDDFLHWTEPKKLPIDEKYRKTA